MTVSHSCAWNLVCTCTWSHASDLPFTSQVTQKPLARGHYYNLRPTHSLTVPQTYTSTVVGSLPVLDSTTHLDLSQTDSLTSDIMARGKRTSKLRDAASAVPEPENNTAEGEVGTPDEHEQTLDPSTSERRYWRDPLTGVQREIWRPGTFLSKRII